MSTTVPPAGLCEITDPDGTVSLAADAIPADKPALLRSDVAEGCVSPITVGTMSPPEEMTSATAVPGATDVPAAGVSLITLPDGIVVLRALVSAPTTKPAVVIAVDAAARV